MNSGLTPLEEESLELWLFIREKLTSRKVGQWEFMELMGDVRDIIRKLENKKFGCTTGMHVSHCTCKGNLAGRSLDGIKWEKRKSLKNE